MESVSKKNDSFNDTLMRIKACDDNQLNAWRDQIEEDNVYFGEHHNQRVYDAILNEVEKRKQIKLKYDNKRAKMERVITELIESLIKRGYRIDELKSFSETFQEMLTLYDDKNKTHKQ